MKDAKKITISGACLLVRNIYTHTHTYYKQERKNKNTLCHSLSVYLSLPITQTVCLCPPLLWILKELKIKKRNEQSNTRKTFFVVFFMNIVLHVFLFFFCFETLSLSLSLQCTCCIGLGKVHDKIQNELFLEKTKIFWKMWT